MFVELMPLLAGRTVMITVAREDDKTLGMNGHSNHQVWRWREPRAHHAAEFHGDVGRNRR